MTVPLKKNWLLALLLAVLFGPLGLLYSGWKLALVLCIISVLFIQAWQVVMFCWGIAVVCAIPLANTYNARINGNPGKKHG